MGGMAAAVGMPAIPEEAARAGTERFQREVTGTPGSESRRTDC